MIENILGDMSSSGVESSYILVSGSLIVGMAISSAIYGYLKDPIKKLDKEIGQLEKEDLKKLDKKTLRRVMEKLGGGLSYNSALRLRRFYLDDQDKGKAYTRLFDGPADFASFIIDKRMEK